MEISCFVHFKVKCTHFIHLKLKCTHSTEINFWAPASSSSKVFLSNCSLITLVCQWPVKKFYINCSDLMLKYDNYIELLNMFCTCAIFSYAKFSYIFAGNLIQHLKWKLRESHFTNLHLNLNIIKYFSRFCIYTV